MPCSRQRARWAGDCSPGCSATRTKTHSSRARALAAGASTRCSAAVAARRSILPIAPTVISSSMWRSRSSGRIPCSPSSSAASGRSSRTCATPAIARLIDGGEIEGGRLWFAMEAVFGERIDHHVRNRALPLRERLVLFEEVCEVVAYAHERRLVHRDIKPGNLLVDDAGKPRLLDFGIAMMDGAGDGGAYRAMTPIYASPEQRAGGVVTRASDIYQLGMLLRTLVMPDGLPCAPSAFLTGKRAAIDHRPRDGARTQRPLPECRCVARGGGLHSPATHAVRTLSDAPPARSFESKRARDCQRLAPRDRIGGGGLS